MQQSDNNEDMWMKKTAIYGAGLLGKRVFSCFLKMNKDVEMFIVTNRANNPEEYEGVPIVEISNISKEILGELTIYVAVDEKYHKEIFDILNSKNAITDSDKVVFLKWNDIAELCRKSKPVDSNLFLKSLEPVSRFFGNDRGKPIDRYYIEKYLLDESLKLPITGTVLEVGEDIYSKRFFPHYSHDVLDYSAGMDLTNEETLPKGKYDVFICTQVFHQIFDVKSAIHGAYYLLKDDGVMLATVCGNITKIARNDEYEHFWGFTKPSIEKLVKNEFGPTVEVNTYGNCMAATAFIQGVSLEEVEKSLLDENDYEYTINISITARK